PIASRRSPRCPRSISCVRRLPECSSSPARASLRSCRHRAARSLVSFPRTRRRATRPHGTLEAPFFRENGPLGLNRNDTYLKDTQEGADLAKLVDDLSALTVLEASELSKMLEEKWGVSAAAPVAVAAAPGAGGAAPAAAAEEKTEFDVVLAAFGD